MKVRTGVVIGIDSKTARIAATVSTGPDDTPILRVLEIPTYLDFDRKCEMSRIFVRDLVVEFGKARTQVFVFIEDPLVGRSIKSSLQLAKIEGACMTGAASAREYLQLGPIEVHEVNVTTWKKRVVGAGNAKKTSVVEWCRVYWGQAYNIVYSMSKNKIDQDLIDATAICFYGMLTVNLSNDLTAHPYRKRVRRSVAKVSLREARRKTIRRA